MRIVLIGQAAFAERVLDGLLERAHTVAAVYCPPDQPGGRHDPVKARAAAAGIPVRQHRSMKAPEVRSEIAALQADLGVMAYVTQIVPLAVIETPQKGSICFHPSLLPRHRGGSAIPWQIILGETRSGVTVFWADAGIDTGPILLQKEAAIAPDDTAGTLYYEKLFPLGVEAVLESVDLIAADRAPRISQDESLATYEPLCRDEHAVIDWERPVAEVYNVIRGCDPQPGAWVDRRGERVRFFDARLVAAQDVPPGVIGAVDDSGVVIGAAGGAIRAGRMRVGEKKVAARAAAELLGLRKGEPI
jgi:methionyl-tRNA formyltransferase